MKLKNKKTGKITKLDIHCIAGKNYESLAEINAEWEDYEEPKEYWYIAELCAGLQRKQDTDNGEDRFNKQIGNYFETKEEAEKAVEKLKAWKRLKDNGFEFRRWEIIDGTINFMILPKGDYREKVYEDLDICFGGDE